jgi:hypothetical protein
MYVLTSMFYFFSHTTNENWGFSLNEFRQSKIIVKKKNGLSLSHWYIIFVAISHATKPRVVYDKKWSWYWYVIFVAISHATKPHLVYDKKWSWYWYIIFVAISHATKPCVVYDKKWSWYCKRVWYMETKTRYGIISLWDQRLVRNTLNIYHHSDEVSLIQHYVIKFISDLRQVSGFLWALWFPPQITLTTTI